MTRRSGNTELFALQYSVPSHQSPSAALNPSPAAPLPLPSAAPVPPPSAAHFLPSPSSPPSMPLFFETLPAEVRNLIYEMAYTLDEPLKVKPKRTTRISRHDIAPEKTSAQMCIINRVMVSTQWFTEVVKIFASRTTLEFDRFEDMVMIVTRLPAYFQQSITKIDWNSGHRTRFRENYTSVTESQMAVFSKALPSLKTLRISQRPWFHSDAVRTPVQQFELHASGILWIRLLRTLRGVKEFGFGGDGPETQMLADWEQWMKVEMAKPKGT